MNQNIFVVGTGRCGSTMLSNIFRQNKHFLSLSEFFAFTTDLGTLIPHSFPEQTISSDYFWQLLAHPHAKQNLMLRKGIAMKEVLYSITPHSYFNLKTGVPPIMQTTLPHISDAPEQLFEELKTYIQSLPPASITQFYHLLFDWLKERGDHKIWIERTGGSLRLVKRLFQHFPNAKFLHIVRDGRNCALSMERHYGFRMVFIAFQLIQTLGIDPFMDSNRDWIEDLSDEMAAFLPENFDAQQFKDLQIAPSLYGHYWSGEICQGLAEMADIPADQQMHIKYEDLLNHAPSSMHQIAAFMGADMADNQWINAAIQQIGKPTSNFDALAKTEKQLLQKACRPGMEALQQIGVHYLN